MWVFYFLKLIPLLVIGSKPIQIHQTSMAPAGVQLPPLCPEAEICDVLPWEPNKVHECVSGLWRVINSNGMPDHRIGLFGILNPVCGRPDPLKRQHHTFVFPAYPDNERTTMPEEFIDLPPLKPFGVAVNGIPFDPAAAEWWSEQRPAYWSKNPLQHPDMIFDLDCHNGHVQPNGAYHYHALPVGLYQSLGGKLPEKILVNLAKMVMLGWAFDGAPVYGPICEKEMTQKIDANWWVPKSGYTHRDGPRVTPDGSSAPPGVYNGDFVQDYEYSMSGSSYLDQCNGHYGTTPEFAEGVYHYHITIEFPYIPRCFKKGDYIDGIGQIEIN